MARTAAQTKIVGAIRRHGQTYVDMIAGCKLAAQDDCPASTIKGIDSWWTGGYSKPLKDQAVKADLSSPDKLVSNLKVIVTGYKLLTPERMAELYTVNPETFAKAIRPELDKLAGKVKVEPTVEEKLAASRTATAKRIVKEAAEFGMSPTEYLAKISFPKAEAAK